MVKPHTAHIVCMKAVPGNIEESPEFTDSALVNMDTSWVSEFFSPLREYRTLYQDSFMPVNFCKFQKFLSLAKNYEWQACTLHILYTQFAHENFIS